MRVLRGSSALTLPPVALTLGNFDGLHRGHLTMLAKLKAEASARNLPTAVMTFEPHPREFFNAQTAPIRLSNLREKLEQFAYAGIDYAIVQPFNQPFAAKSAKAFRDELLAQHLQVRYLLVGDDFRFGAHREGNYALLAESDAFTTEYLETVDHEGRRVSSTAIRTALAAGNLELAHYLLGRPYSISGRVMPGQQLGRKLGFPTANIQMKHNRPPLVGVFVVDVLGIDDRAYPGVASLGLRPTIIENVKKPVLEVHLFDFDRSIYRQHLKVQFHHKLRDEIKFPDLTALTAQIQQDCEAARIWWQNQPSR